MGGLGVSGYQRVKLTDCPVAHLLLGILASDLSSASYVDVLETYNGQSSLPFFQIPLHPLSRSPPSFSPRSLLLLKVTHEGHRGTDAIISSKICARTHQSACQEQSRRGRVFRATREIRASCTTDHEPGKGRGEALCQCWGAPVFVLNDYLGFCRFAEGGGKEPLWTRASGRRTSAGSWEPGGPRPRGPRKGRAALVHW